MIKIETMSPDCVAYVKGTTDQLFVGQLLPSNAGPTIQVTCGQLMYSLDEKELKVVIFKSAANQDKEQELNSDTSLNLKNQELNSVDSLILNDSVENVNTKDSLVLNDSPTVKTDKTSAKSTKASK